MNDSDVLAHINELVAEEHRLYELADDRPLTLEEKERLDEVIVRLDQFYDLLRQRRAREEFGQDPNAAHLRPEKIVEKYLQ